MKEVEKCEACGRLVDTDRLVQTPLGYYICDDQWECIAAFSKWGDEESVLPPDLID